MSWRSVKATSNEIGWHSLFGGRSISAHIARLYTLSAIVLLTIIVGGLQWLEMKSLRANNLYFLNDKAEQIRLILREHPNDTTFIDQEVKVEAGIFAAGLHYILYSRILDDAGQIMVETPGFSEIIPPSLFPRPKDDFSVPEEAELRKATNKRSYLLISAWEAASDNSARRWLIQVALDTADANGVMSLYQRGSILTVILGILLSAYISVLVARSSMRPLNDITRAVNQIDANKMHQRLDPEQWPLELTTLAQAFDAMLGRLEDSHTRLSQFSADLAHELRTPINALMGETEVALSKVQQPEEYRQIMTSNLEVLQRLARMINELLFLARAEDPKNQIESCWFDARQVLDDVRDFHEALAEDRGVTVSCQGQAKMFADPRLIRRAITNLLSNSLRHTPGHGRIILSVEPQGEGGGIMKVSDNGSGIRGDDLPNIFERFFRTDQGNVEQTEGCGLGLSIVRTIAELHGGTAVAESSPGQGTTIILHIPAPKTTGL